MSSLSNIRNYLRKQKPINRVAYAGAMLGMSKKAYPYSKWTPKKQIVKNIIKRKRHALSYGDKKLMRNYVADTQIKANDLYLLNITAAIQQGDGQANRETDKIIVKKVNNILNWNNNWSNLTAVSCGSFQVRCVLFDHDNYVNTSGVWTTSGSLTTGDLFSDTTVPIISPIDYNRVNKIYSDKIYTFHVPGSTTGHDVQTHLLRVNRNIKREYTYKTAAGLEAKEGNLYLGLLATAYGAATDSTVIGNVITSRITSFTDL